MPEPRSSRVYLAAPYAARENARDIAHRLRVDGHHVTSTWIDETHDINPGTSGTSGAAVALSDAQIAQHAQDDLRDIRASDTFVALTAAYLGDIGPQSGGRHVELGYALAIGLPVFVIGEPENVFHRLGTDDVEVLSDVDELRARLLED